MTSASAQKAQQDVYLEPSTSTPGVSRCTQTLSELNGAPDPLLSAVGAVEALNHRTALKQTVTSKSHPHTTTSSQPRLQTEPQTGGSLLQRLLRSSICCQSAHLSSCCAQQLFTRLLTTLHMERQGPDAPGGRRRLSDQSRQSSSAHETHLQTHGSLSGFRPAAPPAAGSGPLVLEPEPAQHQLK
uniref:AT-hook transcription factor n=1 Tax=Nothobranchius pienaari TaxID=704102 RepID=A0A1A8QHU4_9TELE